VRYRGPSLVAVVWIVVGVVVAAIYDYFDSLGTVGRIVTDDAPPRRGCQRKRTP
jgi:hypothetical protein